MVDADGGLGNQRIERPLGGPGFEVVDRVQRSLERRKLLEPGERVIVAVSGGPDSMCLLDVLARLAPTWELDLLIAHVDHGLSPESERVAAHVAGYGSALGYDVHLARATDLEGSNLHERARTFRYGFFESLADREGATAIATGHTLDDRVETTLARLVHGAGPSGLAGIAPKDRRRRRPLVDIRRTESRAYCSTVGIDFHDDPANEDPRFERARIRSAVVPAIAEQFGDGAVAAIATSADRLLEDSEALASAAATLTRDVVTRDEGVTRVPLDALLGMPRAFRRRVLERVVGRARDRSGGIDAVLDALEEGKSAAARRPRYSVAGGIEIAIGDPDVTISFPLEASN